MRSAETADVTSILHSGATAPRIGGAGHHRRDRGGVVVHEGTQ
jgi:hypothetical protein